MTRETKTVEKKTMTLINSYYQIMTSLCFFRLMEYLWIKAIPLKFIPQNEFIPHFGESAFAIKREIPLLSEYGIFFSYYVST